MRGALIAVGLMILALPACATKWKGYNRESATGETLQKEVTKAYANPHIQTVIITQAENPKDPLICGWEPALGSNIRQRVCREEEDLYWKRQGIQTWMEQYIRARGITRD